MALSDPEKTDIRRHCGYPVGGEGSRLSSWGAYGGRESLEFRMNNLSTTEETVLRRQLATIASLEAAVPKSGDNLDTDQAATWSRNRTEIEDRLRLLDLWRRRLCQFIGVRPGPGLGPGGSTTVIV